MINRNIFPESVQFESLSQHRALVHFITTRQGGNRQDPYASFNICDYTHDDPAAVERNRALLCRELAIEPAALIVPRQVHGTDIAHITAAGQVPEADALITDQPGICLTVSTADCVPLLAFDPVRHVIAAIHAGWRGTVNGIAGDTIRRMCTHYGCVAADIRIGIGPAISAQAFEVGEEVALEFHARGMGETVLPSPKAGKAHIDLWQANRMDLMAAGVDPHHIEIAGICTYTEHERFFSARRLGIRSGRISSCILMKADSQQPIPFG